MKFSSEMIRMTGLSDGEKNSNDMLTILTGA